MKIHKTAVEIFKKKNHPISLQRELPTMAKGRVNNTIGNDSVNKICPLLRGYDETDFYNDHIFYVSIFLAITKLHGNNVCE